MKLRIFAAAGIALLVLAGMLWVVSSYALGLRDQLAAIKVELAAIESNMSSVQLSADYLRVELGKTSSNLQRINREFSSLGANDALIREHINIAVPAELSRLLNESRTREATAPSFTIQSGESTAPKL